MNRNELPFKKVCNCERPQRSNEFSTETVTLVLSLSFMQKKRCDFCYVIIGNKIAMNKAC